MTIYQFFFIIILIYLVYNIKNEYNLNYLNCKGNNYDDVKSLSL